MRNAREINRGGIPATLVVFLPIDVFEFVARVTSEVLCVGDLSRDQAVFELLNDCRVLVPFVSASRNHQKVAVVANLVTP